MTGGTPVQRKRDGYRFLFSRGTVSSLDVQAPLTAETVTMEEAGLTISEVQL